LGLFTDLACSLVNCGYVSILAEKVVPFCTVVIRRDAQTYKRGREIHSSPPPVFIGEGVGGLAKGRKFLALNLATPSSSFARPPLCNLVEDSLRGEQSGLMRRYPVGPKSFHGPGRKASYASSRKAPRLGDARPPHLNLLRLIPDCVVPTTQFDGAVSVPSGRTGVAKYQEVIGLLAPPPLST
jgi:hypothetical protein